MSEQIEEARVETDSIRRENQRLSNGSYEHVGYEFLEPERGSLAVAAELRCARLERARQHDELMARLDKLVDVLGPQKVQVSMSPPVSPPDFHPNPNRTVPGRKMVS